MKVFLRSAILYASETYYNLTEVEIRQCERIEESYMRQLLHTKRSCPINQLYFELGQYPARFEIMKKKLLFLKYILEQSEQSTIHRFLFLQIQNPTKGDWASSCKQSLKELKIDYTF